MVHALREVRRALRPEGQLIDMDFRPGPDLLGVELKHGRRKVEPAQRRHSGNGEFHAERAVSHVVEEGLFRRVEEAEFDLVYRFDSMKAMEAYMAEYDDPISASSVEPDVLERARGAARKAGEGARAVIVERALLRSLVAS